jgi:hypothetical protein
MRSNAGMAIRQWGGDLRFTQVSAPQLTLWLGLVWLGLDLVILHTYSSMKMEQTECSETSAYKIQTPGNYPEESIQHSEHGESLKSRMPERR